MSILVAGNYCHDTLLSNEGEHRTLGGSAAYISAILDALGAPYEVLAKVGADFSGEAARKPIVVGAPTTRFVDDYRGGGRRERALARCEPIWPHEVAGEYEIGIACGIAGEIPLPTLLRMRECCKTLIADAQSILREISDEGEVRLRPPHADALAQLDCIKASRLESALLDLDRLRQRSIVIVTDGARGCTIFSRAGEAHVPALPAREVDPTGAGDCFLAGFAAGLLRGYSPERAARLGAYCGARAVEVFGVPRLSAAQVLEAARQ